MMNKLAELLWGAARLTLNPGCLIDRFLDWFEDVSATIVPVDVNGVAGSGVRTEARPDPLAA